MHKQLLRETLSEHDQKVLESLFTPFEIGSNYTNILELEIEADIADIPEEKTPEVNESVRLEMEGIQLAEIGNIDEAILLFDKAINVAHNRGSVYNNRAQALRLRGNDEGALDDLLKAIKLSEHQPRTRCQALCQRGLLYRKMDNVEAAKEDFEKAAKLGSKFARTQLVEINPYAALCNQMLQSVFAKMQ